MDIGITFEKPNNIHGQLVRILGKARSKVSLLLYNETEQPSEPVKVSRADPDTRFATLLSFYKSELAKENPMDNLFAGGNTDYSSPSSFARIMSLYTNTGNYGRKASSKSTIMRGAVDVSEGFVLLNSLADEKAIDTLRSTGLSQTIDTEQRTAQAHNPRFQNEMIPQATLLCTKRSRRCRTCRHILVKPEAKVSNTRYKIKLLALNHIPSMTLKPLSTLSLPHLPPNKALQFLLTLRNPMFEAIKVSLATPAQTPGPRAHNVTILCPDFTLGANADVWDEALGIGLGSNEQKRSANKILKPSDHNSGEESKIAEAGKVWERGRNWTTVVVEVVCSQQTSSSVSSLSFGSLEGVKDVGGEDDDVLEIPLFVRLEYEQTTTVEGSATGLVDNVSSSTTAVASDGAKGEIIGKRTRELAYWAVLGVGRVVDPSTKMPEQK